MSVDTRPKLIVVLGMHRSGTSAITRGLAVLGYALGDRLMPQDEAINAKGYWEDLDVVSLNDEMLEALGRPWLNLSPVSDEEARLLREAGYEDRAWGLLEERITAHGRFAFKDPRLTKLLPFWKPVLDALPWTVRYVLALRNPLNIARSLLRRDGLALEAGCLLTIDHWLAALEHAYGDETLRVVDYDRLLEAPKPTLDELASWCGTALDSEALRAFQGDFLDPRLRHFQIGSESIRTDPVVPALAVELYYALRASADGRGALPSQATVRAWRVELQRVAPMLRLSDRLVMENYRLRKRLRAGEERARRLEGALREAREEIARLEGGLATSSQTVARMAGELNTAGQNHTRLERALEEAGDVISALRAERDEAAERLGGLEQALEAAGEVISGLRAERDEAAGRIGRLEQALEAAGEVISGLRAERDEAAERIGGLNQALEAADEVISALRAERDEAAERIGSLEEELVQARAQSQAAAERLAALYSSTSWRFTRPLRAVSAAARQAWNVPRGPRTWRRGGGRQQRGVADTDPDGRAQAEDGEEPLRWSVDSLILRGRILFGHGWLFHARTQVTSLHFRIAGMGRLPEAIIPAEIGRRRPDVAEVWGEDRADSGFIVYGAFAAGPPRGLRMDIGLADGRRIVLPVPPETIRYAEDASAWPGRWRLFPGQLRLYFRKSKATLREGGWGALKAKIVRRLHARAGSTQPSPSQLIHRLRGEAPHPVVLIVDHDLGGGANHYRRTLVNRFVSKGMTVFLLTYDVTSLSYVLDVTSARDHFRCALADPGMLLHLGRAVVYRKVVYNTAVSFAQPERVAELLLAFKQAHRVSLHIMIHDYYFICPSPFLIDHQGRFCGIPEAGVCARCLQNNAQLFAPLYRGASTEAWRAMWRSVLLESDEITIFSDSSRHLLRRAFPQVEAGKIRVAPHALPPMRRVRVRNTQSLCLGVIGQIGYHKGAAVVRDLAREIVRRGADARIVVIGALETEADRSVVRQTGSYQKDQLPALLEQEGVNVVLFPSVCPETFSYVVHEVIAMDLPLAAFDIGAQGDAVRRYAKGYVLRGEDAGALLDDLTRIFFDLYASARVGNG